MSDELEKNENRSVENPNNNSSHSSNNDFSGGKSSGSKSSGKKGSSNKKTSSNSGNQANNSDGTTAPKDKNDASKDASKNKQADSAKDTAKDAKDDAKDEAKEGAKEAAKEGAEAVANEANPGSVAKTTADTAKQAKETAEGLVSGDLYDDDKDGTQETVDAAKDVALGTAEMAAYAAKGVGDFFAGRWDKVVEDVEKIIQKGLKILPSILKLVIPLVVLGFMIISILLNAPAMAWGHLMEKYEDWTYTKAVDAIDIGISDAAWTVVDDLSKDVNDFLGLSNKDFKKMCNQYYFDYQGPGYTMDNDDGSTLSIDVQINEDGINEDSIITYCDPDGVEYKITYLRSNLGVSEVQSDVSYSEVISAFNQYRENLGDNNKTYKIFHQFTNTVQEDIKTLNFFDDLNGAIAKIESKVTSNNMTDEELKGLNEISSLNNDSGNEKELDSSEIWAMEDTASIYYYMMTDKKLQSSLYSYSCIFGNGVSTYSSSDSTSSVKNMKEDGKIDDKHYEMTIDVNTFLVDDKETESGEEYSSAVMDGFNITDPEQIKKVAGATLIADALIDVATEVTEMPANDQYDFSTYLTVSQSKALYEKLVGSPSLLEQLLDDGLYGDKTEDEIREMVAAKTTSEANQSRKHGAYSATDQDFIFRSQDKYSNAFEGTATYYSSKNGKLVENKKYKYSDFKTKYLFGEDGVFVTYIFWKSIYAGNLPDENGVYDGLKPRPYLFPETVQYKDDKKKALKINMFTSEEYYNYFQTYSKKNFYFLMTSKGNVKPAAWDKAFDDTRDNNGKTKAIQKGDLIFFNYQKKLPKSISNAYQVGIVTNVNYKTHKIVAEVYNYDYDPIKSNFVEELIDVKAEKYIGMQDLKVQTVTIDYDNATTSPTIKPVADAEEKAKKDPSNQNDAKTDINPLVFVTGYAKPNYQAYVDEINKRLAVLREKREKSIAESALDSGSGTLGYPLTNHKLCDAGYGYPNYKTYKGGGYHGGIDIGCDKGTKVYACDDGKVIKCRNLGGESYGQYIQIKHKDGKSTIYAHLSVRAVKEGDSITRGQYIGKSGDSGKVTGPHLHLEYRTEANDHRQTLDPRKYFANSVKYKFKGATYFTGKVYDKSPYDNQPIKHTAYDSCWACNEGPAVTATGKKLANTGKYYDEKYNYIACGWLPYGTKLKVTFPNAGDLPKTLKGKTLVYVVEDTGFGGALQSHQLDIFIPNSHANSEKCGTHKVKIEILSMPSKYKAK